VSALHAIHDCPRCELRFEQLVELLAHLDTDHPEAHPPPQPRTAGRVTVPLDPDRPLPLAIDVAVRLASQARLEVDLVSSPGLAGAESTEAFLEDRARAIRRRGGVEVTWHALDRGPVPAAVHDHVAAAGSDLLCLPTRAGHGPRHLLFGSVAEGVLRQAAVPVLMVGPHVTRVADRYRTVVACVDGSPEADTALHVADRLCEALGAELVLIDVVEPRADVPGDLRGSATLERTAGRLDHTVEEFGVLYGTDVGKTISAFADGREDVIVVTGTRQRVGTRIALRDSVAHDVIRRSRHPVLVVPAGASADRFLAAARSASAP
jgi:nucleotide-binding universal stress UspA family protein